MAREARGASDRSVSGMDLRAPVGTETVCDLAEHDREADLTLGKAVGSGNIAVCQEDKEFASLCLDLFEQHFSGRMRDGHAHQTGQDIVRVGGIGRQSCVLQAASSLTDPDSPTQMIADFGGEGPVTAINGILNVTQDVGEADLVLFAQFLLAGVPVGNPYIGLMAAQHLLEDMAHSPRSDLVQDCLVQKEHPLPMDDAIGARSRLVRRDNARGEQLVGNRFGGCDHLGAHAPENIGDCSFGDG